MEKIATGVNGLDKLLDGGFPKGAVIAVSGGVGTGKSVLAAQFLMTAKKEDSTGLLISFDLSKKEILEGMKSFDWDMDKLEAEGKLIFIEFPPGEVDQLLTQDDAILDMVKNMGITRVVIDPITSFSMLYPDKNERRSAFFKLISKLRSWGVTALIIDQDDDFPLQCIPKTQSSVESLADGFVHLSYLLEGKKRRRGLEIIKMRGCPDDTKVHDIKIDNKGMSITDVK